MSGSRTPRFTGRVIKKCSLAVTGKVSAQASRIQGAILESRYALTFELSKRAAVDTSKLLVQWLDGMINYLEMGWT